MFNNTRGYPQLRAGFGYPYPPDFLGTRHTSNGMYIPSTCSARAVTKSPKLKIPSTRRSSDKLMNEIHGSLFHI